MSATTATNSLTSTQQREREKQQRERERQRGLQFQFQDNSVLPIANGNVHFSGPIKHEHEDATAKRIKDTLGEFNQMKDYIVSNHKQLVSISTSLCRTKMNNANKAKIEQIFSEMKNNIQPLTGLEDNEIADINDDTTANTNLNHSSTVNSAPPQSSTSSIINTAAIDRKESNKLKELNLNNSSNKHETNASSTSSKEQTINKLTNHNSSIINYSEHSDRDLLDELSDESQSSNRKKQSNHQLNHKSVPYLNSNHHSNSSGNNKFSSSGNKRPNNDQQDENYLMEMDVQSDDSSRRKRAKNSKTVADSVSNSSTNNCKNFDHPTVVTKRDDKDDSSVSSDSDSDSCSSSSASSSSDNISDSDSVSSSTRRKDFKFDGNNKSKSTESTGNSKDINSCTNKPINKEVTTATVTNNNSSQQPQRSWALSTFCNNLNNTDKLNNLKSPPIVTKAQLKQTVIPNADQDKVNNVIDSVVKGKAEQLTNSSTIHNNNLNKKSNKKYYDSDSSSSSFSSKSSKFSKASSTTHKNKNNSKSNKTNHHSSSSKSDTGRQKRSHSPLVDKVQSDLEPPNKASKKSVSSDQRTSKKHSNDKEDREERTRNHCSPVRNSYKESSRTSPLSIKKENKNSSTKSINKELPKNLPVSIDLSTLEKKSSDKLLSKSDTKPKSSKDLTKETLIKKEADYKDKYRSNEKKSSKDKYNKYDKEKSDRYDKYDKKEKYDKHDKQEKKSKKSKDDDKSSKKRTKTDEESSKESSKQKKSTKESTSKKEDQLKESIKNELFDKPVRTNETISSNSSNKIGKESTNKSGTSLLDKESNRETNRESNKDLKRDSTLELTRESNREKATSSTFKEPSSIAQKSSSNHHNSNKDEIDYQKEGTKWKHTGDREKDPIKQYCKYLEAALYFLQFARHFERKNENSVDKIKNLYTNTLTFLRSALQNKFVKPRTHGSDENRLSVLGLRLLSLTMFHVNKLMIKEMRQNEKHIRTNLSLATKAEDADPSKPDQPLIVNNKMQLSIHLYSTIKKQLDYLNLYNDLNELWLQADHILDTDTNSKVFFKKVNAECGLLCLNSNVDDLVPYVKAGLKHLNINYS